MKTLALILISTLTLPNFVCAQPSWTRPPVHYHRHHRPPIYRSYPVYRQPGQVSAGAAVAGAVAVGAMAGIIGYQLGKQNSKTSGAPNCKTVNIDNDQKQVCRDANGNWNIQ